MFFRRRKMLTKGKANVKLIVGLGNPGEKYTATRHNIGSLVLEGLLKELAPLRNSQWAKEEKTKSEVAKIEGVILARPQTFMNACGFAVVKLVNFYKIEPSDFWVVHDDLDLPLGKIKIRQGGGTAGHHGLESITRELGTTDFVRFRLGIGRPRGHDAWEKMNIKRREVEKYVLSEFRFEERKEVRELVKRANKALQVALGKGLEEAMNRFNQ